MFFCLRLLHLRNCRKPGESKPADTEWARTRVPYRSAWPSVTRIRNRRVSCRELRPHKCCTQTVFCAHLELVLDLVMVVLDAVVHRSRLCVLHRRDAALLEQAHGAPRRARHAHGGLHGSPYLCTCPAEALCTPTSRPLAPPQCRRTVSTH